MRNTETRKGENRRKGANRQINRIAKTIFSNRQDKRSSDRWRKQNRNLAKGKGFGSQRRRRHSTIKAKHLQLGTIAQRGRGNGLSDLKIRTQQKKNFVSTVDQDDNSMDCVATDSLGIRVESLGQFLNSSRNRADSRRAENRPFETSRFRPYATDRLHDRTLPNLGNQ
ncbi:hypothetical protein niasHT_006321 [Heterodera trifolii]|uniref:Uncharacterized protein n=1 Tax=Heterodera trifolii TaxID=157864 RepID=A0ABD2M986_9BILA